MNFTELFDSGGSKRVTPTDTKKRAYVITKAQRAAIQETLELQGKPIDKADIEVTFLDLEVGNSTKVMVSFYPAYRSPSAMRAPEYRLGRELASTLLKPGKYVSIGSIGTEVFVILHPTPEAGVEEIGNGLSASRESLRIREASDNWRAKNNGRMQTSKRAIRDPWVVAFALKRADGLCEMPECTNRLFRTDNDKPYLEVHHLTWLRDGGSDSCDNVATLCPSCHREVHFGRNRLDKTDKLRTTIAGLNSAPD